MADKDATMRLKADISQLQSQMQKASRTIKLANAEFKTAAASMDKWSDSEEGLKAKLKQLNTVLGAQKTQLSLLEAELEDTIRLNGENSAAADKMRLRVEGQKAAIANTEKQLRKYDQELAVLTGDTDDLGKESKQTEKEISNLSDGFTVAKGVLADLVASGIKAAITGLKNLAGVAKEAYAEFDKGADNVIKATGATGDAAKELESSYKAVAKSVVGDMGDIGSALGEVNTRFGFTGKELEDATENFLKFADITGTDATDAVRLVSRAIENAGMESSEYAKLLDILAKAGQATGVDISTLAESVTKLGAPMRQLGFTTEESIALFAQFEKSGVNTETAMTGMRRAVAQWTKEGKNAKEEFSKVLEEISKAPDITGASEKAIEAFGTKAGPELAEAIQGGKLEYQDFLDVLKKSEGTVTDTYEATQDGFDKITLAIQGGKADLGAFIRDIATEYQDDIVGFLKKVKDGIKSTIKWIVQNGDLIIETLKSIGKVIAVVFVTKKLIAFAKGINTIITAVKAFSAASKAAAAAQTATNAATGAFSALVSPGGAIVLGIAAVAAVTYTLIKAFKEEKREIDVLTDAQKASIEASHNLKAAYDEMESARRTSMASVNNEFQHYQSLIGELDSLVGANGKVKEGYEDRVTFITTTLNDALGLEMQLQDGVIQNYSLERQKINELIETKRAELILQANEEAYTEAVQKKTEATNTYLQAQKTFNEVMAAAEEAAVKVEETYMEMARIESEEGLHAAIEYQQAHQDVFDTYSELSQQVTNTRAALMSATDAYQGYNQTIQNYEGLSAAIIGGDSQKIQEALLKTESGFRTANNTTSDALKTQRDQYDQNYKLLKQAVEKGDKSITQQMVDDAKALAEAAQAEYEKGGTQTVAGYVKGLEENSVYAEKAAQNLGYGSLEEFNKAMGIESPSKKTYESGGYFADGFINGMGAKGSAVYNKAKYLAQQAIAGLKDGQKEGSPSKITTQSGKYFTEGFINGIGSMSKELIEVVKSLVKDAIGELDDKGMIQSIKSSAAEALSQASTPISFGQIGAVKSAVNAPGRSGISSGSSTVNNTYNLVQNNNSPKSLSALETYQARRQQVAMIKAMM